MIIEYNKNQQGHILILRKDEELNKTCFVCGKEVNDIPFFLCELRKRIFHSDCESGTKCFNYGAEHSHFKIIGVEKSE